MSYSTEKRPFHLTTPLREDALLLHRFEGDEALSQPFEFRLSLVSEDDAIDAGDLVGQRVTLWANREEGDDDGGACWSGIVASFGRSGSQWFAGAGDLQELTAYEAIVVPWFWQLKLIEDCRIFQNQSIPDIVDAVLGELQLGKHEADLSGSYAPLDYCVQYGESSYDFIARLLEDAGIHYFFRHDPHEPEDILVISDRQEKDYQGQVKTLRYAANWAEQDEPVVFALVRRQRMRTGHVTMRDFDFTRPTQNLEAGVDTMLKVGARKSFQSFRYPGGYADRGAGDERARLAMEIEEAGHELLDGASTRLEIHPGVAFQLDDAPNDMLKPAWRALRTRHRGENNLDDDNGESYYRNDFTVMPLALPYRPRRDTPRPRMRGPQTAIVTGPAGEEIYTDQYGRVKVHFFWDHRGSTDDKSTCWIRVSQAWAGRGWGTFFVPRIGMEVIVDFLDGDPDRPLVTGCVYNGDNGPPYALPGEMTKSTIKTSSSKGGNGFNELRFEDKQGSEEVFLHAQKALQVRVGGSSASSVAGNRSSTVGGDSQEYLAHDEEHLVGHDRITAIKHDEQWIVDQYLTAEVGQDFDLSIGGSYTCSTEYSTTLRTGWGITAESKGVTSIKAGTFIVLEAAELISLKVGGSSITLGPAGVTIDGPLVQVNCGGSPRSASQAPTPEKPDKARQALEAIMGKAGKVSDPAQQAQAEALQGASAAGLPFCAECAAAEAELAEIAPAPHPLPPPPPPPLPNYR